jgi:hypothetical protein
VSLEEQCSLSKGQHQKEGTHVRGGKSGRDTTYLEDVVIRLFYASCDRFALHRGDYR